MAHLKMFDICDKEIFLLMFANSNFPSCDALNQVS